MWLTVKEWNISRIKIIASNRPLQNYELYEKKNLFSELAGTFGNSNDLCANKNVIKMWNIWLYCITNYNECCCCFFGRNHQVWNIFCLNYGGQIFWVNSNRINEHKKIQKFTIVMPETISSINFNCIFTTIPIEKIRFKWRKYAHHEQIKRIKRLIFFFWQ